MISIQTFLVFCIHDIRIDRIQVKWHISNRFKIQEFSILILLAFTDKQFIFQTHTVRSFDVDSRFIRNDHTWLECIRLTGSVSITETCRSLVDVQKISNPMSCSVIEVQSSVPKRLSCQIIKVHSAAAFLEDRTCKVQVTDRNQCKMIFHNL